jgi:hypothetical protein
MKTAGFSVVVLVLVHCSRPVFLKLWYTMFRQLVRGDQQEVSEEKRLQKLYQTMNE